VGQALVLVGGIEGGLEFEAVDASGQTCGQLLDGCINPAQVLQRPNAEMERQGVSFHLLHQFQ
jgi:hypothetical protein